MKTLQTIENVNNKKNQLITTNYIITIKRVYRVGELQPIDATKIDYSVFIGWEIGLCANATKHTDYTIPCGALIFLVNIEDIENRKENKDD